MEGAPADGKTVADVATDSGQADQVWVTLLVSDRALASVGGDTRLMAGDEVLVTAELTCTRPGRVVPLEGPAHYWERFPC